MKKGNLDIYELIWEMRDIAREVDCIHNGCVVGDLMIDAVTFSRMLNETEYLWHIEKGMTWIPVSEDQFGMDLYRVRKENDLYTIEKIK